MLYLNLDKRFIGGIATAKEIQQYGLLEASRRHNLQSDNYEF